jgi:hypothetical protein
MGTTTTTGTNLCPKTLTVTLAGQTSSSWATDAIVKAATAIKTDSDGYKMTIQMSSNLAATHDKFMGGCLSGAGSLATNPIVCFYGKFANTKTGNSEPILTACIPYYAPAKNFSTTVALTGAVAITNAKWYMVLAGSNCSAAAPALNAGGVTTGACIAAPMAVTVATSLDASWFQPKEISTKIYPTMPRFSAKESATWIGMKDDSMKNASGCTAKALTGASALVAGAAVAFGAAALAF